MSSELDRIKFKIKALAAKTVAAGCSEQEAMSAMLGVGRLLSQYNLTMQECDVRESACKTLLIDAGRKKRHPIDACITSLANLVNAKCWYQRHWQKTSAWAFFGQEGDLELIEYLYHVIRSAMDHESEEFKNADSYQVICEAGGRRTATVSFQHGMAFRIAQRLQEIKKANDEAMAQRGNTGRALVVLKDQIIKDEFAKLNMRLHTVATSRSVRNIFAYGHGKAAGDKVNLSRPLKGGNKPGGLLS